MTQNGFLQLALYFAVLLALVKPLGAYMALALAPPMLASKPLTPPPEGFPGVGGHVDTGVWLPHPVPAGLSSEANCAGVSVAT